MNFNKKNKLETALPPRSQSLPPLQGGVAGQLSHAHIALQDHEGLGWAGWGQVDHEGLG